MNYDKKENTINHNIKTNIIYGISSILALSIVNPYFAKFAERLGATDYHIAYLSSLPAFVSIFSQIPGAILIEGVRNKQKTTAIIMLINKCFYLLIALVPFVNRKFQPSLFVILVGLMNFPGSIYITGYQAIMGDIFDVKIRNKAMSLKNKYSDISKLFIIFISGQLLNKIPSNNKETIVLYQIFFVVAFFLSIVQVISFLKFKTIELKESIDLQIYKKYIKKLLLNVHKEKEYLSFVTASLIFHFGWQMGWPLFSLYNINYLGADEGWLSLFSIASGLSAIITVRSWGKLADKKGNSLVSCIATFGISLTPFLVVISRSLKTMLYFHIIIGVSVAGIMLVLFNLSLDVTKRESRTTYLALYNTLVAISATIAPIIGVWLKKRFNIYIALYIVGFIRITGSLAFVIRNIRLNAKK